MSLLDVSKLTVKFGEFVAVNSVDFQVEQGKIISIIGPNGAGKTTVFNAITGICEPAAGAILFKGALTRRPWTKRTIAAVVFIGLSTAVFVVGLINSQFLWEKSINADYVYQQSFPWAKAAADFFAALRSLPLSQTLAPFIVGGAVGAAGAISVLARTRRQPYVVMSFGITRTFQNIRLFHQMTVLENVLVGMDTKLRSRIWHDALRLPYYWRERSESLDKASEILEFVGLESEIDQIASCLPYGSQRRLEIARALASGPSLLLLDEPAAGMNPSETQELMGLIRKIRDRGVTILLIEHDMRVVMNISDRIVVLDYGLKIAEGSPAEIKKNPRVIEAYLGKESADGGGRAA